MRQFAFAITVVSASLVTVGVARAQPENATEIQSPFAQGIIGQFDNSAAEFGEAATITTRFTPSTTDQPSILLVTAKIAPGKHTYSLTQPPGGPRPTQIELEPSAEYRLLAPFRAHPAPNSRTETGPVWTGLKIEEHEGEVTWYAPIELTAGVDPKKLEIRGAIHLEVCETGGTCEPVEKDFAARGENVANLGFRVPDWPIATAIGHPQSTVGSVQLKGSAVKLSGRLVPSTVRPGESAELHITATVPVHGRVYALAERDPVVGTKPVLIAIQTAKGLLPQLPTTDAVPKIDDSEPQFGRMQYHEGAVTWTQGIDVPKNAPLGEYPIAGLIGYQACEYGGEDNNVCELPHAVRFAASLNVAAQPSQTDAPLTFAPGDSYSKVAAAASILADFYDRQSPKNSPATTKIVAQQSANAVPELRAVDDYPLDKIVLDNSNHGSLSYYIALAFLGGLILNLMPCVLPVIGLKVMSFVEQAGKSRTHAFALNAWFAAGIIAVFLLLGVLAATLGLAWGGQFGSTWFNVTIASVVFAMALSLLGVWEVPIPGFFGSGSVQSAAAKEGPLGAFFKGVVTTVLATPCGAPFMAPAIAWAVTQPTITALVVFTSVGVGMASPYLLVGVYPELLRFLPKPGAWMETFKQISGFVLLATVVFILSFIEPAAIVPTVALLLGIGVACWLVARTPLTADFGERLKAWGWASTVVLAFVGVSFGLMYRLAIAPVDKGWQPFSLERLKQVAVVDGQTVLVDFSAEWCLNCKLFEKTVLHTKPVEQAIKNSNAVTMYADYTNYPSELTRTIKALGGNGVPVIAIFPGNAPFEPMVFHGGYRQQDLVAALSRTDARRDKSPRDTNVSREPQSPAFPPAVIR